MGRNSGDGALGLLLQFARASESGDPYGVRYEPQDYILPTATGATPSARFEWSAEVLADLDAMRLPGRDPAIVQRLGEQLRTFVHSAGWLQREREIAEALAAGRPVILTIRSSAAELYALPWELLTLQSGQFIGEVDGLLLRFEWPDSQSKPEQPKPRSEGGRILFAWSAAAGAVPAAEHLDAMTRACEAGHHPFHAGTDMLANASLSRITQKLEDAERTGSPIAVLHLLCHGASVGSTFGLALTGEHDQVVVDATQLRQQLAPFARQVRLIVISACDSGNLGALGNRLGSVAQALHRCGFQAVIASRYPLSVRGSIALTETFYHQLLSGPASLEYAFLAARKRLAQGETDLPQEERMLDWASMQLYARHADGDDTRPVVFRPYRGLLAFQQEHRRFFFGREEEITEVLTDLQALSDRKQARFLIVAGASGTGKSSLVFAGAVPKLLRARPELAFFQLRPGNHPEVALNDALAKRPAQAPVLLVVDQLEEVFTQTASPAEREVFVRRLWSLASSPESGVQIVLTLRVDFLGRCGELAINDAGLRLDRIAYDEQHRVFIAQLGPEQLRTAIEEPAHKAGLELQAGLVDRIVQEVGAEPGALPLLEDALDALWQQRRDRTLTQSAYEALGGVVGSLQKRADAILNRLSQNDRDLAQRLLISLVAVADDTALDSRLRVPVAELRQSMAVRDADGFDRVLNDLVDARLLVQSEDKQSPTVEVAHEALIRKWPRLRTWIDEDRAGLVVQRRVKQAAQLWDTPPRDDSLLFRGAQLAQAVEWRRTRESQLGTVERSFLDASEAFKRKQDQSAAARLRQTRIAVAVLAVLFLGALGAGGLAIRNATQAGKSAVEAKRKADEARATLLVALSQNVRDDPTLMATLLREPGHQVSTLWRRSAMDALQRRIAEVVLRGHTSYVYSVAISPDGTKIATGSQDRTVRVWKADGSGSPLVLTGHEGSVTSVAFSPNGTKIATGSQDKTARIWNADGSGAPLVLTWHGSAVHAVAFSPDGKKIVTGSQDRTARICNTDGSGAPLVLSGHKFTVTSVAFSPDGKKVVTGGTDTKAHVFNADGSGAPVLLTGHQESVTSVAFSPDGTKVVTGSQDHVARIFNADGSGTPLLLNGHQHAVMSVAFSPDGTKVVTGSQDQTARVWSADGSGAPLVLTGHASDIFSVAFRPDGKKIVTGSRDTTARIYDAVGSGAAGSGAPLVLTGHRKFVTSVAFSPDGKKVLTGGFDQIARIFHADGSGTPLEFGGHHDFITSVVFSPDGKKLATGSEDGTAHVFNADGSGAPLVLSGHEGFVTSVAFGLNGQKIVTGCTDNYVRIFNADGSGAPLLLTGHKGSVTSVAFSPDGTKIATGSVDTTARIWNADGSGAPCVLTGRLDSVTSVAFSPDGTKIVTGSVDTTARIYNADCSGVPVVLAGHQDSVTSVAFSLDGKMALTGSRDGTARIYNADGSGAPLVLAGHQGPITSVAISPDGSKIATGSEDTTVRIWTVGSDLLVEALWSATTDCLPERRRQELLAESPADAQQGYERCRQEVARRRRWTLQ